MFGLFKNSTPEGKLENEVKESLEQEIRFALNEVNGIELLAGYAIERAISNVYKAYSDYAVLLSKERGISLVETVFIIKKATNNVRNKYLNNPTPIE